MKRDEWFLDDLIALAEQTARSEWNAVLRDAEPLSLDDLPGKILIGTGFYGDQLTDGWHRVAGLANQYDEPDDVLVPVWILTERETQDFWDANG